MPAVVPCSAFPAILLLLLLSSSRLCLGLRALQPSIRKPGQAMATQHHPHSMFSLG